MDVDAEKQRLQNELGQLESYLSHPISREILRDNQEQQDGLIDIICNRTPMSFETFFAHFEAVGELRGLRRARAAMEAKVEELTEEIKNLQ